MAVSTVAVIMCAVFAATRLSNKQEGRFRYRMFTYLHKLGARTSWHIPASCKFWGECFHGICVLMVVVIMMIVSSNYSGVSACCSDMGRSGQLKAVHVHCHQHKSYKPAHHAVQRGGKSREKAVGAYTSSSDTLTQVS
jgi:hypothetical protein